MEVRNYVRFTALVLLLIASAVWAAPVEPPPLNAGTRVPGLDVEKWKEVFSSSKSSAQEAFQKYHTKVGLPEGSKLQGETAQCMFAVGCLGLVQRMHGKAGYGSTAEIALRPAVTFLEGVVDFWCKPPPGQKENKGLEILREAARAEQASKLRKWGEEFQEILGKKTWTTRETVVVAAVLAAILIREAVPVIP